MSDSFGSFPCFLGFTFLCSSIHFLKVPPVPPGSLVFRSVPQSQCLVTCRRRTCAAQVIRPAVLPLWVLRAPLRGDHTPHDP